MRLVDLRLPAVTLVVTSWLVCRMSSRDVVLQISRVRMTTMAETADMQGPLFDDYPGTAIVMSMVLTAGPSHDYFTVISPKYLTSYIFLFIVKNVPCFYLINYCFTFT